MSKACVSAAVAPASEFGPTFDLEMNGNFHVVEGIPAWIKTLLPWPNMEPGTSSFSLWIWITNARLEAAVLSSWINMFVSNQLLATGVMFDWLAFILTLNLHSSNDFALFDSVLFILRLRLKTLWNQNLVCLAIYACTPKSRHKTAYIMMSFCSC